MDRCFALFDRLNADSLNREAMIMLHYQGLILHQKRYHYDSIRYYDRALHYAEGLGEWQYIARIYDSLGQAFGDKGLFKEAFEYYERSIKSKQEAGDDEGLALTLGNKGRLHMQAGEYRDAMDCFRRDLALSEKLGDVFGQIMMHSLMGQVHWIRWESEQALQSYQLSHSLSMMLSREHADSDGIGFALMGQANCYLDVDDHEKFEETLNALRDFAEQSRNRVLFLGQYHLLRGNALERKEDLDGAETAYLESMKNIPNFMSKVERGLVHERLAVLYGKKQAREPCIQYMKSALRFFEESNAHRHIRRVNDRMHRFDPEGWFLHLFKGFIGKRALEHVMKGTEGEGDYGQEKEAVILFSDIRSFTSWSESIQARDLVETLNDYLSVMTNAIERHRGDIDKYIGDAIMSVFEKTGGTPAQAAANALRAAWNMFSELYVFNRVLADKHKPPIRMGVGVHSGHVISGTMGSRSRKNFTVIGDVVNTASRIEGLTKEYGVDILVSETVRELCADDPDFIFREVDTVRVKGKARPIIVYELFHVEQGDGEGETLLDN